MIRGLNHGSIGIPQGQTRGGQATVVERAGGVCVLFVWPSALALPLELASGVECRLVIASCAADHEAFFEEEHRSGMHGHRCC